MHLGLDATDVVHCPWVRWCPLLADLHGKRDDAVIAVQPIFRRPKRATRPIDHIVFFHIEVIAVQF